MVVMLLVLVLVLVLMVMLVLVRLEVMVMLMLVVGDAGAVMVAQPYYERETRMAMVMASRIHSFALGACKPLL